MSAWLQNNYPETLGKTIIINAPTGMAIHISKAESDSCTSMPLWRLSFSVALAVFKMVWAVVRPMLDVRTQAKIEVSSCGGMPGAR